MVLEKLAKILVYVLASLLLSFIATAKELKIVIVGDSITEGYGIEVKDAYPSLLETKLKHKGLQVKVINGGTSGASSASAVRFVKWYLKIKPDWILLELGGNDGLRGQDLQTVERNLADAIELIQKNNIKAALAGMQIPTNYGVDYQTKFAAIFPRLAKKYDIPLIPFLLKDVGGVPEMNLPDGIHPNKKGHQIVAETAFQFFLKQLKTN